MRVMVLGAGLVGRTIAADLAQESGYVVTAVDRDAQALARLTSETPVQSLQADLREPGRVGALVADHDLIVCAVPGFMGFETLRQVVDAGKNVVDISFSEQDPFLLDDLAKARGVTAVVDCGVAPGLSNILAGHLYGRLDRVERFVCFVGGLPQVRTWPYEYKVVFSPWDVLEEYTRPARYVEHGREVVRPALSDVELIDFPGVGTLEAFNTDGLRSLRHTLDIPFMKEKTLRYPGHADLMRAFRETGFFDPNPVEVEGQLVRPLALSAQLLFEQWRMGEGDADLTMLQVEIHGYQDGQAVFYRYDLLDRYDPVTQTTSMARTTGFTCAIVARQVASGLFRQPGICPPEYVGQVEDCYLDLMAGYARRDIRLAEIIHPAGSI